MNKLVRKFELLLKSISIYFETRRLKREIKDAYSDKPSSFQVKHFLLVLLILSTIGATVYFVNVKMSRKEEDVSPLTANNNGSVDKSDNSVSIIVDSVTKKTSVHKVKVDETHVLKTDQVIENTVKNSDSNIIKRRFPSITKDSTIKYLLIADKGDRIIHLFERSETGWFLARTFPVASGAKTGKKTVSGDLKTPEGIYFIEGRKEGDSLNEIYGPLAYVLNYPNRHDVAAGRTGNGIWIHGTTPGEVPVDTKGCLELHNDNLIKLSNILGKGDLVPVVIHSNEGAPFDKVVNLEVVWEERNYILEERRKAEQLIFQRDSIANARVAEVDSITKFVSRWAELWETMEIDSYSLAYDTVSFKVPGYNWKKWKNKKISTFKRYKTIDIEVSKVNAKLVTDTTAVADFRQVYQSNLFRSVNRKRLSMKKVATEWKITAEISLP